LSSINFLIQVERDFFICLSHSKTIILFSSIKGIQSATVQIAAMSIVSVKYFKDSSFVKNSLLKAITSFKATQDQDKNLKGYKESVLFGFIIATASSGITSGTK